MSNIKIFYGGDILTMEEHYNTDSYPEAVAIDVDKGKIIYVGAMKSLKEEFSCYQDAEKINLKGKTLIPAFFDPHSHLGIVASDLACIDLHAPPVGKIDSLEKLKQTLKDSIPKLTPVEDAAGNRWICAMGYDHTCYPEQRHPDRSDLDQISPPDISLALFHASFHFMALNSKALKACNITNKTQDPPGGKFQRIPGSKNEPNGLVEEIVAMEVAMKHMPTASRGFSPTGIQVAQMEYAKHGITTAQEPSGITSSIASPLQETNTAALTRGEPPLTDTILYPSFWGGKTWPEVVTSWRSKEESTRPKYTNAVRYGGVKVFLDGSFQLGTAFTTQAYHKSPLADGKPCFGYPTFAEQAIVDDIVEQCFQKEIQLLCHMNGDGAGDQLISAVRKAIQKRANQSTTDKIAPVDQSDASNGEQHPPGYTKPWFKDHRTVLIHGQTLREDQLVECAALGIYVSFFTNHVYYWGESHLSDFLGPERAHHISPANTARKLGVKFTIHNDAAVTPLSLIETMDTAVNRLTQMGNILGADECLPVSEALRAVTIYAAQQHFEDTSKGSIAAGKVADLVVLSENPLKIEPEELREVKVIETIRLGRTVFKRENFRNIWFVKNV